MCLFLWVTIGVERGGAVALYNKMENLCFFVMSNDRMCWQIYFYKLNQAKTIAKRINPVRYRGGGANRTALFLKKEREKLSSHIVNTQIRSANTTQTEGAQNSPAPKRRIQSINLNLWMIMRDSCNYFVHCTISVK